MNGGYVFQDGNPAFSDTKLDGYSYAPYYPTQNSDFNDYSTFRIFVDSRSLHYVPQQAYIEIKGQLVKKTGGTAFAAAAKISFTHNPVQLLFRQLSYKLNGEYVERVDYPGFASNLLHNVLETSTHDNSTGLEYFFVPDDGDGTAADTNKGWEIRRKWLIDTPDTEGTFAMRIPLSKIFGFAEYPYTISKYSHEIEFNRQEDYYSLFKATAAGAGKLKISSVVLWMPHADPSLAMTLSLKQAELNNSSDYVIHYRKRMVVQADVPAAVTSWDFTASTIAFPNRPQWLFVGFQTGTKTDQDSNFSLFKHLDVQDMFVVVNTRQYPQHLNSADFAECNLGRFYRDMVNVRANLLGVSPVLNETGLTPSAFRDLRTIFAFDLTKGDDEIKGSAATTILRCKFAKAVPTGGAKAYILMLSDAEAHLKRDGSSLVLR